MGFVERFTFGSPERPTTWIVRARDQTEPVDLLALPTPCQRGYALLSKSQSWRPAMTKGSAELVLEMSPGPDADSAEVFELTSKLRRELLALDVESVERPTGDEAPEGTRGVEITAVGTLVVQALTSAGTLKAIVARISEFLSRGKDRTATLSIGGDTLQMTGLSSRDQERLVSDWVERHADRDEGVEQ